MLLYKNYIKRSIDFLLALVGSIILLPFMLPLVLLLRFTGEGEIFYLQERMGYKNKVFGIIKFATMLKDSLNIGSKTITVKNDPRITSIGKYLRISKINELPQIINVLKGDMALVGPRPLLVKSFQKYTPDIQAIIYQNRPGITGIGSLIFRDEERLITLCKEQGMDPLAYYQDHIYPYKGALEEWYTRHISFSTDIKILLLTLWVVLRKDSRIVYRIFRDLPPKPEILSEKGLGKWAIGNRQ
jgi:lipopolysaccharide/colanic/teichoic acid biosynthesis glycosyltransferase